jgi:hypothetical protein
MSVRGLTPGAVVIHAFCDALSLIGVPTAARIRAGQALNCRRGGKRLSLYKQQLPARCVLRRGLTLGGWPTLNNKKYKFLGDGSVRKISTTKATKAH